MRIIALVILILFSTLGSSGAFAAQSFCGGRDLASGLCNIDAGIGDGQVDLEGSAGAPGTGGGTGGSGESAWPVDPFANCEYVLNGRCLRNGPGRAAPVDPITLTDIASFRPVPGRDSMEPDGWMIVGLDTNFYATTSTHVVAGTLLGQPASVRFTPVAYHWTYGDGTSATRTTRGSTWAALGIPEFEPTATSHVYRAPGTYVIDLVIDFAPEYQFAGQPWVRVDGVVAVPANRLVAVAGDAKTVLVDRECTRNPSGPGC